MRVRVLEHDGKSAGRISAKTRTGYLGGGLGREVRREYLGVGAWERNADEDTSAWGLGREARRMPRRAGYRLKMRRAYVGGGGYCLKSAERAGKKELPERRSAREETIQRRTSACAATQRMVNPLLAGGYEAAGHQTFRQRQTLPSSADRRSRNIIVDSA